MCSAVTFNMLRVRAWAGGGSREAELKLGENRIRVDPKTALKLWGIERCPESSTVGWKYTVKFSLKP